MATTSDDAKRAKEVQACSTAETFANLYYDRMDGKRHIVGKLYLDSAVLSWNGNKVGTRIVTFHLLGAPNGQKLNEQF